MALVVKNPHANAGDIRDTSLILESGRSPGEGNGNALQYSYLQNPMNRGAWQATVHRVAKSRTQLRQFSISTETSLLLYLFSKWNIVDLKCCASLWCKAKWLGYTHMYILFYIIFYYGLLWDTDYGSLCFMLGSCYLSILYITVCIYQPQTFSPSLFISSPHW